MSKKPRSIRVILLSTISALTLLVGAFALYAAYTEWRHLQKITFLRQASFISNTILDLSEKLEIRRGATYSILYAPDQQTVNILYPRLIASRKESDKVMQETLVLLKGLDLPELKKPLEKYERQVEVAHMLRQRVDEDIALPFNKRDKQLPGRWFKETAALTSQTMGLWLEFSKYFMTIDPVVSLQMRLKHVLAVVIEYSGRERAIIGRLITESRGPTAEEQAQLLQWRGTTAMGWKICRELVEQSSLAAIKPFLTDTKSHYESTYNIAHDMFYVPHQERGHVSYPITADMWLELSMQVSDSFSALKDATMEETLRYVETMEMEAKRRIAFHLVLLVTTLVLCYCSFYIVTLRVIVPINRMVGALLDTTQGKKVTFTPANANQQDEVGKLAHVLGAFQQNVEQIKRTSSELERYTKDLERSNKELDDFAYIASHDLKEPLRGIHNHARFLLEDNEKTLDEDSVGRLNRLIYLSQRMEKLVNDLLYFSRLGRQELAVQPTDLNGVIEDIKETLELFLEERHAKIIVPKPLPEVVCDKTRVTEVFRNLVTNAVKYNDKPEKIVEIGYLGEHTLSDGKPVSGVFYVKDNGQGIAKEFYEEVFRIFKRLQHTKGKEEEGTGVGLTFVKKIIDRHGGKIWLESEIGKGTVFYFSLGGETNDIKAAA